MTHIENHLKQLRLLGMAIHWEALTQTRQHHELSLSDGLEVLLQAEQEDQANRRFQRLKSAAKFRYSAGIEELNFDTSRGLNKSQINELATYEYINKGEAILITGATGCGKSFAATALGDRACLQGIKVMYFNTQKLLIKTKMARLDGTIFKTT
jgi:DNA replication protein DnaC